MLNVFFYIDTLLVLSWYIRKSVFNKGVGAWNFFELNWNCLFFWWWLDLPFGLQYFTKIFSFKYELASFEHWDFHSTWMTCILSASAFVCLTVSWHNCSWIAICESPHAHHEPSLSHMWPSLHSACVFALNRVIFHLLSQLLFEDILALLLLFS